MLDYKDMTCQEGVMALRAPYERFTVLRPLLETPPMAALAQLMGELERGDMAGVAQSYHMLTAALLCAGSRRVSGDLFQDFLLNRLLEVPNPFALFAAKGEWDEPLCAAMRYDLTQLGRLSGLGSAMLKRWIGERLRELKAKPRQARDAISAMSSAIWAGTTARPAGGQTAQEAAPAQAPSPLPASLGENEWVSWRYQLEGLGETYVADEALEEMYHRLLHTGDWGLLLDDLWNFHNAYGAGGEFLRYRVFRLTPEGVLAGQSADVLPPEDAITLYERQRERLERNVIRFMQGERAVNMLLSGPAGSGKTTQILSLARELPEVRLVLSMNPTAKGLARALATLKAQPFRFLLFLDDLDFRSPAYPALRAALRPAGFVPENVLVCGAAREGEDTLFPLTIPLFEPQLKEFIELVLELLLRAGRDEDFERVQNLAIDYAAAKKPLSFQGAYAIVNALLEGDEGAEA